MLPDVSIQNLVEWTGGVLTQPCNGLVSAISTDSRSLKSGEVFLALRGDNFDGHDFLPQAAERGAQLCIAEADGPAKAPVLKVGDSTKAMMDIARGVRGKFMGPVFALTGSAGKSSTKEMIGALLGPKSWVSPASFNNRIGVSKTLFALTSEHEKLVLEMGMNALGEIAEMCAFASPRMGLITNIGDAHMGRVGGREGVYRAKRELFDHLAAIGGGVAVNREDAQVERAFSEAFAQPPTRFVTYSARGKTDTDVALTQAQLDPVTGSLAVQCRVGQYAFGGQVPVFGEHHGENLAAALAAATLLGAPVEGFADGLATIRPAPHRGEVLELDRGRVLVDEAYNSNPTALGASLKSLAQLRPGKPRLLVLGEMLEMGEYTQEVHRAAGEQVARLSQGEVTVVGVGPATRDLVAAVPESAGQAHQWDSVDDALEQIEELAAQSEVVFIKGSRGNRLEKAVARLQK